MSKSEHSSIYLADVAQTRYDKLVAAGVDAQVAEDAVMYWISDHCYWGSGKVDRPDNLNPLALRNSRKCSDWLIDAFVWRQTPQGHDFWEALHKKLRSNQS